MARLPVDSTEPSIEMRAFAENIRDLRIKSGLSQRAFAEQAGITQAYLVKVEKARTNLSLNRASQLAEFVGTPLWKLIKKSPSHTP